MNPFEAAWSVLKALPSQQEFLEEGPSTQHLPFYDDDEAGVRFRSFGTMHPQAVSMAMRAVDQSGKDGNPHVGYPYIEREPRQGDKGAASEEARKDEKRPYSMIMPIKQNG